jgi:hypothetical protein
MNLNQKFKNLSGKQQGCLVIALLFVTFIVTVSILMSNDKTVPTKDWQQMTYEERQKWIEAYLKDPDDAGYQLVAMMDEGIKNKFSFPKEVDFEDRPTFLKAYVVEADSGWVFVNGKGNAKNAYGVKVGFSYQCKLTITKTKRELTEIRVNEHE